MTGVKLTDLFEETATATLQVGGTSIGFTYRPLWLRKIPDDEMSRIRALPYRKYAKEVLPRMLVSWDLIDNDGAPIPVTAEAIDQHELPEQLLLGFEVAAVEGGLSGKASSNGSRAG